MDTDNNTARLTELLQEVNDNQKRLLDQQAESVQLQREQIKLAQRLVDRPTDTSDEAERYHKRGSAMMDRTSRLFLVIIFLLVLLLFYVTWVLFA